MRNSIPRLAHGSPEPQVVRHSAQVLQFRPQTRLHKRPYSRSPNLANKPDAHESELLDDLARYEQDVEDETINDRQRMMMNVVSLAVVTMILGVGVWIANTIT